MNFKKFLAIILVVVCGIGTFIISAGASDNVSTIATITYDYEAKLVTGGDRVYTNLAVKDDSRSYLNVVVYKDTDYYFQWDTGNDVIYIRARNSDYDYASSLITTDTTGSYSGSYYSWEGVVDEKYCLAMQADDANDATYVAITGYWRP